MKKIKCTNCGKDTDLTWSDIAAKYSGGNGGSPARSVDTLSDPRCAYSAVRNDVRHLFWELGTYCGACEVARAL